MTHSFPTRRSSYIMNSSWTAEKAAKYDKNGRPLFLHFDEMGELENSGVSKKFKSEEHTSELQSLMRISYAVFCLKKKTYKTQEKIYNRSQLRTCSKKKIR